MSAGNRVRAAHAPDATLFTNETGRHILATLAPDSCGAPGILARSRVVALDALVGTWVDVPGANVRVLPIASAHPDQIGQIHFGEGSIDEDLCALPESANGWLEGLTLAFLIDFLDDDGGSGVVPTRFVFGDGFESGDATAWSSIVGAP